MVSLATRADAWRALFGVALVVCAAGCGPSIRNMSRVRVSAPALSAEVALVHARALHYEVEVAQPARGRIGLRAHYQDRDSNEHGRYRIAIVCEAAGCEVYPIGPRVERLDYAHYRLPERLMAEIQLLADELARAGGG